jgi:hypothetical protein
MQLGGRYRQEGRRDAAYRLANRESRYGGYGDTGAYGPYRSGFRSSSGGPYRYRKRSAPNIFWEGLENLARDPLGWLDVDRPSYLRGSAGWYPRQRGRSLGDGVVSRTYGKRNLYESDSDRAARYGSGNGRDYWNRPDGLFEGPNGRKRERYWDRPGRFEGPNGYSNSYSRYDSDDLGYSGARRTMDQSRYQAFEREDSKNDWMEGAQGPQTSIRRSEAL